MHLRRGDFLEAKRLLVPARTVCKNLRMLLEAARERAAAAKAEEAALQVRPPLFPLSRLSLVSLSSLLTKEAALQVRLYAAPAWTPYKPSSRSLYNSICDPYLTPIRPL